MVAVNDNLTDRIPLRFGVTTEVSIGDATLEGSSETDIFDSGVSENSVWYEFTPSHDGTYGLDTFFSDDFGAMHWVCTGTGYGDLTVIQGPFFVGGGTSYDLVGGTTYLIRIARSTGTTADVVTFQMREYVWGPWTDNEDPEYDTNSVLAILIAAGAGDGTQANVTWDRTESAATRAAFFSTNMTTLWGESQGEYDGHQDDFFIPPASGTGTGLLSPMQAIHDARAVGKVANQLTTRTGQLDFSERGDVMTVFTNAVEEYTDTPDTQYETPTALPIAAHLDVDWTMTKTIESDIFTDFQGSYEIAAYYPTTGDRDVLDDGYLEQTILGTTTVTDGNNGSTSLDLSESDFAPHVDGFANGIVVYGKLSSSQPDISGSVGSGNHTNEARLECFATIDPDTASFTFRRPRFRSRELVPVALQAAPRRLHPRRDGRGLGNARQIPPPTARRRAP